MSAEEVVYGFTGEYVWTRKRVWFWRADWYFTNGWSRDFTSGNLRPIMVFQHRRPNGARPFDAEHNPAPSAPSPKPRARIFAIRGTTTL